MAKITISLDEELYEQVRTAAGAGGVSAWLAQAAAAFLRVQALDAVASEIAAETGGPFSTEELAEARARLRSSSTAAA